MEDEASGTDPSASRGGGTARAIHKLAHPVDSASRERTRRRSRLKRLERKAASDLRIRSDLPGLEGERRTPAASIAEHEVRNPGDPHRHSVQTGRRAQA